MKVTRSVRRLRVRTHAKYVDGSEDELDQTSAPAKKVRRSRKSTQTSRHNIRSPFTPITSSAATENEPTRGDTSSSASDVAFTPGGQDHDKDILAHRSPTNIPDHEVDCQRWAELADSSAYRATSGVALHMIAGLGDRWPAFQHACRDGDVRTVRGFAREVQQCVDLLTEEIEDLRSEHRRSATLRAEERGMARYIRYATERDARKDVKKLARRLAAGPGPISWDSGSGHTLEDRRIGSDENSDESSLYSSEESESEGDAMQDYLLRT
ncbi:hypothetical protein P7C70_g1632, partial [Phenoliferia sp. Uapishka_3]